MALVPPGRLLARLIALGQFDPECVGDREVTIVDASRSNPVHIVVLDGEPAVVVKQAGLSLDEINPVEAEAAALRWVESHLPAGALAPRLLSAAGSGIIVTGAIAGGRMLHDFMLDDPEFARLMVQDLAGRLASLHRAAPDGVPMRPVPWALRLEDGPPEPIARLEGVTAVVADLLGRPAMAEAARDLRERWRAECMIHGDVKFDNVLVTRHAGQGRCWLIDWELGGGGLPEWDLAGVLEGLLAFEIAQGGTSDLVRLAAIAGATLRTYRELLGEGAVSPHRAMAAVVVRLGQTAVQIAAMRAAGFTDHSVAIVPRLLNCAEDLAARLDEMADALWRVEAP